MADPLTVNGGFEYRETLGRDASGASVLGWLAARHRHSSEAVWRARIAAGEVSVDGALAAAEDALRPGQRLAWRRPPWEEPQVPLSFAVLYRDAHAPRRRQAARPADACRTAATSSTRCSTACAAAPRRRCRCTGSIAAPRGWCSSRGRPARARSWPPSGGPAASERTYRALVSGVPREARFAIDAPIGRVAHPRLGRSSPRSRRGCPRSRTSRCSRPSAARRSSRSASRRAGRTRSASTWRPPGTRSWATRSTSAGGVPGPQPRLPGDGGYRLHAERLALAHPTTRARLELECVPPPELREASGPRRAPPSVPWSGA